MYTGFAISLAWPQTWCKQSGSWYDSTMKLFGFNKNNFYKVGHAAVILIEASTGKCLYFDFGRYHAPYGYGRVRDSETDHDLLINSRAVLHDDDFRLANFEEILIELANNEACHGIGELHASYTNINFEKAYQFVKQMQNNSPWKYGPFILNGTNCSRFVRTVVLSGNPPITDRLKIYFPLTLSPTPVGNVKSLKNKVVIKNRQASNNQDIFSCNVIPT